MNEKRLNVRKLVIIGMLGAISVVLGMTPLGFIPVGPTRATIMHIPVIIGSIMEGPLVGGLVGLIFGLFSIYQAVTAPTPVSFVFLNPLVSILPRVLIGISAYYTYSSLRKLGNKRTMGLLYILFAGMISYLSYGIYVNIRGEINAISILINLTLIALSLVLVYFIHNKLKDKALDIIGATIVGTLTNTMGVLFMIYFLFAEEFVEKLGGNVDIAGKVIAGIGLTNGIPEAIIAIIIVTSVVTKLKSKR